MTIRPTPFPVIALLLTATILVCGADVVFTPGEGDLRVEAAAGMTHKGGKTWDFKATNFDPYTKPVRFPSPFLANEVKIISIELEKNEPAAKDRLELWLILGNRKITASQRLSTPIAQGRHRYLFEVGGILWFTGDLTAIRIDPGTSPGDVSIKQIGIFSSAPTPEKNDILVPIDASSSLPPSPSAVASADTFKDAALVRCKIASGHLDTDILADYRNEAKVLKLQRRSSTGPEGNKASPGTVDLAASTRVRPLAPVIPPYVGLNAEKFSVRMWVASPAVLTGSSFNIETTGRIARPLIFHLVDATPEQGADGWLVFSWELPDAGQLSRQIINIRLTIPPAKKQEPDASTPVFLARPLLFGKGFEDGYDLLNTDAPLLTTGMVAPLAPAPVRPLPVRDTLTLGGYEIHKADMRESIPALAAFMQKEFPDWDFVLAPVWTPPLSVAKELPNLPGNIFFQFQKTRIDTAWLSAAGRMPKNAQGQSLDSFGNSVLATDPATQAGLKSEIDYAASLGINNFKQIDYVWPWWKGRWGYDEASVAAYREDLSETDEGLSLLPGLAPTSGNKKFSDGGVIHFRDYYEYYHGFRPKPADLGLQEWAHYKPVSERTAAKGSDIEKRNLGVFILLYHYEWLRQAQRFGRWAKAHGGAHGFTLNPEDLGNGGDFVFLSFLADAGTPYIEYFGGPSVLRGAWHNLPFYVEKASRAGKKLALILEKGQAGHGQHYFDPEINYLYAFETAAAGLRNYHNEWIESNWRRMSDPKNEYLYDRWSNWMTGALGFTFAREKQIRRPETRVYNIAVRSPGYYVGSWITGLKQGRSFGPLLDAAHVDYKQWERASMPEILNKADVLFYAPLSGTAKDWELLRTWLSQRGKTLVTHTNIPFLFDNGQARLAANAENVTYTDIEKCYSDFLDQENGAASRKAAVFPEFREARPISNDVWSPIPGARILLGDAQNPLLSEIALPGGSRIHYLHKAPQNLDEKERARVMEHWNLPRAVVSSDAPVMAHHYKMPGADVLNVWTGLDKPGFKGGYGPHLLPKRGAREFDRKKRPYPWRDETKNVTIEIPVSEAGEWRVYAFLSGGEFLQNATAQNTLRLNVDGALAEQFYYAKEGPAARELVSILKKHRERLFPWCPDMPH
ncbi:hypothetical protein OpiT1DRAFT_05146 [Opitutaceae bacterium TAV1]|nr:hypothetical protein OpiT1DRAFT_05146 [Opitutaceae bacterium TAV1]